MNYKKIWQKNGKGVVMLAVMLIGLLLFIYKSSDTEFMGAAYDPRLYVSIEPENLDELGQALANTISPYTGETGQYQSGVVTWGNDKMTLQTNSNCESLLNERQDAAMMNNKYALKVFTGIRFLYYVEQNISWCDNTGTILINTMDPKLKDLYFYKFIVLR